MQDTAQLVTVDEGDLSEAMQAANAWAAQLRKWAYASRQEYGALPFAVEQQAQWSSAADRIDAAVHRLAEQANRGS